MNKEYKRREKADKTEAKLRGCGRCELIAYLYWYNLVEYENLSNEEIKDILIQYSYDHNKTLCIK